MRTEWTGATGTGAEDLDLARAIFIALAVRWALHRFHWVCGGHVHDARSSLAHKTGREVWTGGYQRKEPLDGGSSAGSDSSPRRRYGDKAHDLPHAQWNPIKLCRTYADYKDDYSPLTRTVRV